MNMKEYKEKYPDFDKVLQGRRMTLKKPCGGRKPEGDPIPLFKPIEIEDVMFKKPIGGI